MNTVTGRTHWPVCPACGNKVLIELHNDSGYDIIYNLGYLFFAFSQLELQSYSLLEMFNYSPQSIYCHSTPT